MITRPATRDDLAAVVEMFQAYDLRFRAGIDTDESDFTDDWSAEGFDWADSTLVLEDGGTVVGYATAIEEYADAMTVPGREDLLPQLLDWLEAHPQSLEHYVPDGDDERHALVERRGWVATRRFWRMRVDHAGAPPAPAWPEGVRVRAYDRPRDDEAVHALITTSFREIGGQHERPLDSWRTYLLDTEKFDPELYLVAERDGRVVGACLSQLMGFDYGFVRQLAVAPSERGQGLGLALLHEAFARHLSRGMPASVLGVDAGNPTGALGLYEKAGMRVVEQFTRWDRPTAG